MLTPNDVVNQTLNHTLLREKGVTLSIKRLDLIHPQVSGNKYFKLKYNIKEALSKHHQTLLTFGGAYSNHIAATAFAAQKAGLVAIGVIRGENIQPLNPTLELAQSLGMNLHYVSREEYRKKTEEQFQTDLKRQFGDFYLVPEGGTNQLAIKGTQEILTPEDETFTHIVSAIGTGGTIAGLAETVKKQQSLIGISSLKGTFIHQEIQNLLKFYKIEPKGSFTIFDRYHFGGYAKYKPGLIDFIWMFYQEFGIVLDPIYTGKTAFANWDLIQNNYFPKGSSILIIHTGGIQGNLGFIERTGIKLPTLSK
ncbi:1-aminocyclopropane-1-carboxylate deaminase/D-cysteine desulfhydrase [Algoriphagus lutimaris]|nr:1-aminocyclopropane-1-carboxylate deaminase/D-cysteine desulfhydrase [Algoriphagus lutimaris]